MIADVTFERTIYQRPPTRFEAGTPSLADALGLGTALTYLGRLGMANVARHERGLLEYAVESLAPIPRVRLVGDPADRAAVISFVVDGVSADAVGVALDRDGIAVRAGHHCAQPLVRRFGVESTVRASMAVYRARRRRTCGRASPHGGLTDRLMAPSRRDPCRSNMPVNQPCESPEGGRSSFSRQCRGAAAGRTAPCA